MAAPRRRYLHLRDRYARAVAERCEAEGVEARPLTRQPLRPFRYVAAIDPSPNKAYLQRVLRWYLAGRFRVEDARTVRGTLAEFRKAARRLPVASRDINRYASPGDVAEALESFRGEMPAREIAIGEVPSAILRESPVLASGEAWTLLGIGSYTAAAWWAKPTSWCTRGLPTYDNYAMRSPLRVMLTPAGRVQFHAATDQIMDRFDRPTTPDAAGWPKEARDAAAAVVARDLAEAVEGRRAPPVLPVTGEKSLLHLLAGMPAPRRRERWNPSEHFGDNVASWLVRDDGTLHLVALSEGELHVRRMGTRGRLDIEPGRRRYRTPEDWRKAPASDRGALRLLARGNESGVAGLPLRGAIEIFAIVRDDADLASEVLEGGGMSDTGSIERRIALLACAARHPAALGGKVDDLAEALTSLGMADAVATSLTAIFGRGKPIVEAVIGRASPAARRIVGAIRPAWLAVHPMTWTDTHHPGEPASRASDAELERHFYGEGLAARMLPYRFLRRDEAADADPEDLVAVLDGIREAVGIGYRHMQRGYLATALAPDRRDEALFGRLVAGRHRGLLAAAPLDRLPSRLLRELSSYAETPIVLEVAALTPAAALTLADLRGPIWDDNEPVAATGSGSSAERAMAGFANSFLRHRRAEWAHVFARAYGLAFGRHDAASDPADERACAGPDAVSGAGWLVRADHLAGVAAARLHANGRSASHYYDIAARDALLANPTLAATSDCAAGPVGRALRSGGHAAPPPDGDEDLRAELLARDWHFVRRMTRSDVNSNQWQFLVARYMADAWRRGDLARRNAIANAYRTLHLGLDSIAPQMSGAEFRAWVEEREDAPMVDGRPMRPEDIGERDRRAARRSAVVANRFGALAGARWLLRALLVAAREGLRIASRALAELLAERARER